MSEWTSVDKDLPNNDDDVLVASRHGQAVMYFNCGWEMILV